MSTSELPFEDLSAVEAQQLLAERGDSLCLLDVRTAHEHASHHIPGCTLIPVQELVARVAELDPDRPTLVYCEHGIRSVQAAVYLEQRGFGEVFNLRGGIVQWTGAMAGSAVDPC